MFVCCQPQERCCEDETTQLHDISAQVYIIKYNTNKENLMLNCICRVPPY